MIINQRNYNFKSVVLVSYEMSYTGSPRSLLNLSVVLKKCGFDVDVYTVNHGLFENEFSKKGFIVKPVSSLNYYIPKGTLVIFNTIFAAEIINNICNHESNCVLFIREARNLSDLFKSCDIDKKINEKFHEIICVSEYSTEYINAYFSPKKLWILHNYVDDVYQLSLNYPIDGTVNFLVSGTYEKRKGIDIAVEAFLRIPEPLKAITRLHIVGPKPNWSIDYQKEVESKYDNRIIEYGELSNDSERISLYKKMNVFVISSRDEACSLVALEGAMLGKLLIMSETVGASYLLQNKNWIYQTEDIDQLCRKMCNATSRKQLIFEGLNNRRAYKKTSTQKIFRKNLSKILDEYDEYIFHTS